MVGQKKRGKGSPDDDGAQQDENEPIPVIKEENIQSGGRPRSNSYGQAPVPVASLKVGTRVAILGTENVQQRFPHLEGCIGVIKEAPGAI